MLNINVKYRGKKIGLIFQDPQTSLNPILTIGEQLIETILTHLELSKEEAKDKDYVDTKNRIFYGEEVKQIDEAQKKTVSGTNYITKVSNKQLRQTTNPEDSDPTSQK